MVFINLSKLLLLIQSIQSCPTGVPKRIDKLYQDYNSFNSTSDHIVSIHVSMALERLVETHLDKEDKTRQKKMISDIIETYTKHCFRFPLNQAMIHLISPLLTCDICGVGSLVVVKPSRKGRTAVVYTLNGGQECELYHKHCSQCQATVYSCYTEYKIGGKVMRKYLRYNQIKYFGVTTETFFETSFLASVTEDLFTCHSRVTNIVDKYNRLNPGKITLNKKRLFAAWLIYSINKSFDVEFPVIRGIDCSIDIESACEFLYPKLKCQIDAKWIKHKCKNCESRIVVMDGAAKVYRTVCSAKGEKLTNFGQFNEFTACSNSPLPGFRFCTAHMDDKAGDTNERLDTGVMTRQRRKELGLHVDELTSMQGCRKREAITVRSQRSKTAGMLYCYRSCGVSLGHVEMIDAETCTAFLCLLIELFGTSPKPEALSGVAIDRACDVHPYCKRLGQEGNQVHNFFYFFY